MAVRGLRGVSGLEFFAATDPVPIPFADRSEIGGYGWPLPETARPGSREFGTDARAAGRSEALLDGEPLAPATAGLEPAGTARAEG
jgi:hypothetical protein